MARLMRLMLMIISFHFSSFHFGAFWDKKEEQMSQYNDIHKQTFIY